jgi:hypothetical protein
MMLSPSASLSFGGVGSKCGFGVELGEIRSAGKLVNEFDLSRSGGVAGCSKGLDVEGELWSEDLRTPPEHLSK